jgi:glucosamine--fructose-6-phosphate aminotransferase (isomerizing)
VRRERNAHPHFSGDVAVVHNGIIENHEACASNSSLGYVFTSDTDTEVIAHLLNHKLKDQPT